MAIEILRFSNYIGFYNTKTHKRLPDLKPNKRVKIREKSFAYDSGYATLELGDLHVELKNKKYITLQQYKKLTKKYKRTN